MTNCAYNNYFKKYFTKYLCSVKLYNNKPNATNAKQKQITRFS